MRERLEEGWFGHAKFVTYKRGFKQGFDLYGHIVAVEASSVLFRDNDDYMYLPDRADFKFERKVFKVLTNS